MRRRVFATSPPTPKDGLFLPDCFVCTEPFHFDICQTWILWDWKTLKIKCFTSISTQYFIQADFFFLPLIKQIFLFTFPIWIRQVENRFYRFCCCSASELNTEWLLCHCSFSMLISSDCTWMPFHRLLCVFTKSPEQLLVPVHTSFIHRGLRKVHKQVINFKRRSRHPQRRADIHII